MQTPIPIRILLVDDQPLFRGAIASLIDAQDDMTVVGEAENGLDAVEKARLLVPDLVSGVQRSQPQMGHSENLCQAVVHLPGDPPAFGKDRMLSPVLAHLGTRDGDRGQARKRHEE